MLSKTLALGVSCQPLPCISIKDRISPFVGKGPSGDRAPWDSGPDLFMHVSIQNRMLKLEGTLAFSQPLLPLLIYHLGQP